MKFGFGADLFAAEETIENGRVLMYKPQTSFFLSASDKWVEVSLLMEGGNGQSTAVEVRLPNPEMVFDSVNCTRCIDIVNTPDKIEVGGGSSDVVIRISRSNTTDSRELFGLAYLRHLGDIPTIPHNEPTLLHVESSQQRYYLINIGSSTN